MVLEGGDKVLVAHRRLYPEDHPRYFAGIVDRYQDGLARVTGFTWVRDPVTGEYVRKGDQRTKIVALGSGSVIVYQLPHGLDIEALHFRYERCEDGKLMETWLTDESSFEMDLSERFH